MAGLFTLIFGTVLAGSAIRCGIDNAKMMSKPCRYMEDGTPVYLDRLCNEHVNGEKIVRKYNYQLDRWQEVGERSGKVYRDPVVAQNKYMEEWDNVDLEQRKKFGLLAYNKWYPQYERKLTTEISTGKIIAAIWARESRNIYRKFYLKDMPTSRYEVVKSSPGDFGVPISKEEYRKLDIACNKYGYVDFETSEAIGTEKDPYRDVHPE